MPLEWPAPPRLLVVGDLCLDRYTWGEAERVSPEAPVLVLRADRDEVRLGSAASVASLLRGLGAQVTLAAIVGDDPAGRTAERLLDEQQIARRPVFADTDRPTTSKERILGRAANRHAHQIVRVDREVRDPLDARLEARWLAAILEDLATYDAVVISDYAKGACTPGVLEGVIGAAGERGIPTAVDPARGVDYHSYRGATVLTPNRAEAAAATGHPIDDVPAALAAAERLCRLGDLEAGIVTLDCDGMAVATRAGLREHVPTRPRAVYDVTGAGDMVLAVLGLGLALKTPLIESVRWANVAAGLEIERLGVSLVSRDELRKELLRQLSSIDHVALPSV